MTNYRGIDYGNGKTNINTDTGIRFGVIPLNDVVQAWADSSQPWYGDTPEEEIGDFDEPINWYVDDAEYRAESDDNGDIFIIRAPFFTYAQYCSPCAPGACYLPNPLEEPDARNKCYCFGHDWFDSGVAPYPVYSVATGARVEPEKAADVAGE